MTDREGDRPALHYVGFRGDEYHRAVRIFGMPDFVHIGWDRWARIAVVDGDVVLFARGTIDDMPSDYSYPDIREDAETRNVGNAAAL